jgi:hypothetical protein
MGFLQSVVQVVRCLCGKTMKKQVSVYRCTCGRQISLAMGEAQLKKTAHHQKQAQQVQVEQAQIIAAWEEVQKSYGKPEEIAPEMPVESSVVPVALDESFTLEPLPEVLPEVRREQEEWIPVPYEE